MKRSISKLERNNAMKKKLRICNRKTCSRIPKETAHRFIS